MTDTALMHFRRERVRIETDRHEIEGTLQLPNEGFRSRTTDFLNAHDRDFIALTDAEIHWLDGTMMSLRTADPATPGVAQKLFQRRLAVSAVEDQYDVTADGQRFLVIDPEGQPTTRLTVLTNWPAALKPR